MKKEHRLKITFEYDEREFTSSIADSSTIQEVGEALTGLLVSSGYHIDTVKELFYDEEDTVDVERLDQGSH